MCLSAKHLFKLLKCQQPVFRDKYPVLLLLLYVPIFIWAAINPLYRNGWFSESILVFLFVPLLVWSYYKFRMSNVSYTLIFLFLVLHTIGSHYTYAEVPFGYWMKEFFGFERNNYDRLVHFSFGLLMAYPVREFFLRVASTHGVWGYWFPIELTAALSGIYELMEWGVTMVSPDSSTAFLATQGDPFDAQKDMALATSGAVIAMLTTLFFNWKYNEHFWKHMEQSLRVKIKQPLGENMFWQMLKKKKR
jgi:putative membrane protein